MGDECPFCNECTLSWEDYGNFQGDCAGSRVCTSCGAIVDENYLTADEGIQHNGQAGADRYLQASARERQQYNVRCGAPSMSRGRRQGLDLTKRIAHFLDCKPSMTAEAVGLFERLYEHPHFRSRRIIAKLAMAACCVYIICRQHNWPVMLADVCSMVGKSIYAIDSWKKRILAVFPDLIDIRAPDLFELLSARCEKACVSNEVQQTAIAIIKLCRDLWVTEGRKQDNVIIAALFLAWQSEEPACRLKTKLPSFCRSHRLQAGRCATSCVSNMQRLLCRLADKIPWVTASSVSDTTIAFYVKDIINYRNTLIAEARSEILHVQSAVDDIVTCDSNGNSDSDVACRSSPSTVEMSAVTADHTISDRTINTDVISKDACSSETTISEEESYVTSSRLTVKRQHTDYYDSFWPPPGYRPYKRLIKEQSTVKHPDLDCAVLSSHDIPDEDMHLYIKSTAEQMLD